MIQQFDSMHQWCKKQRLNRTLRHLHLQLKLIKEKIKWISTLMKFTFRQLFNWLKNNGTYLFPFHNKHTYFLSLKILLEKSYDDPKWYNEWQVKKKEKTICVRPWIYEGLFILFAERLTEALDALTTTCFNRKRANNIQRHKPQEHFFSEISRNWQNHNAISLRELSIS